MDSWSKLIQGHVVLNVIGNEGAVLRRYGLESTAVEKGIGRQIGKVLALDNVAHLIAGDVSLEKIFDDRDGGGLCGLGVGNKLGKLREGRNEVRAATLQIPEVVQVAVGKKDKTTVLGLGVFAGLFLADERILVLRLGLKDDEREAFGVEQQEVDEALARLLEVVAEGIQLGRLDRHAWLKSDVGGHNIVRKETPACRFEQFVDFDAGCGFFTCHSAPQYHHGDASVNID